MTTGAGRLVQAAGTQDKPAALRWCRCGRMPAKKKIILGRLADMGCVGAGGWRYAAG